MRHFRDTTASHMPQTMAQPTSDADAATALQTDVATSPETVRALREDWEALARTTPSASPFQDFGWATAWMRAFVEEAAPPAPRPHVVRVRAGGRPLLLWPLQIDRHAGMRRLTWLSMPALQYGGVLMADMPEDLLQAAL